MKNEETKKNQVMIDAVLSSRRQRITPSDTGDDSKIVMNPATAALEELSRLPQREQRQHRNHPLSNESCSESGLEKRNHVFDMADLFNVSQSLEGFLEFPPISWTPEEGDNKKELKKSFASKRSTSFADALLASPKSPLVLTRSSSTTSLLKSTFGKKRRLSSARSSKRLVRSIAMNSNLSMLATSDILCLDRDACFVTSNYCDENIYPNKLHDTNTSTTIKLHECLKILESSELYSYRRFSKKT